MVDCGALASVRFDGLERQVAIGEGLDPRPATISTDRRHHVFECPRLERSAVAETNVADRALVSMTGIASRGAFAGVRSYLTVFGYTPPRPPAGQPPD